MRPFRHLTPRYIWNRTALIVYERANPGQPWLTPDMIKILDSWLCPADVGLEFGSGRSTSWFAAHVKHLTSVEHNPEWYSLVQKQLQGYQGDYFLREDGSTNSPTSEYVNVAKQIAPASLDFCLIDGVARDHCALASLDKLKAGGLLIIDNANWYIPRERKTFSPNSRDLADGYASEVWAQVGEQIKDWRCVWTTSGVTDTAFWVKP
ncbi:MAG: hypothetical protein R3F53_10735 [Gammaproteobacteria bacterium]